MNLQRFSVFFTTDSGSIEVEARPSELGVSVGFHYNQYNGPRYHNGPITVNPTGTTDSDELHRLLKLSWVDATPELVEELSRAACLVKALAENTAYAATAVSMRSEEFGSERFGPHHDMNESLASISRLVHSAKDDGIERVIGVIVNDENDWTDDDEEFPE